MSGSRSASKLPIGSISDPSFRSQGIVSLEPPKVGKPFPTMVPQVDSDGNETAGIRLPEIQVPLATYTGWNLRAPELGAADELYQHGRIFHPFCPHQGRAAEATRSTSFHRGALPEPAGILGKREKPLPIVWRVKAISSNLTFPAFWTGAGEKWDYLLEPRP